MVFIPCIFVFVSVVVPEIVGMALFFSAIVLSAYKLNEDFGRYGELGYVMLIILITIYAAAIGVAFS